jgi:hypothetical protein
VELTPESCGNAPALAKRLGCSTDFLLGLTDEPRGVSSLDTISPRWLPGHPEKSGLVVLRFSLGGAPEMIALSWYDAEKDAFCVKNIDQEIPITCLGWWPVPEEEDDDE